MEKMKQLIQSLLILFSEGLWIYCVIVLFTSLEWEEFFVFDALLWGIAAVLGYSFNALLGKKIHTIINVVGNLGILSYLVYQSWVLIVPEGAWGFGLALSIGLLFIYVRSASFCYLKPLRRNILRCFEGNILAYVIFASIFTVKGWEMEGFHLAFISAIGLSLIGMILSLQSHTGTEAGEKTDIRKVGKPGSLSALLILLFASIPLMSLVLLLPTVNHAVMATILSVWEGIKWLGKKIMDLLVWLMKLLPKTTPGTLEGIEPEANIVITEGTEEYMATFPVIWLIAGLIVIFLLLGIWIFAKVLKNRKPMKAMQPKQLVISKDSWWENFKRKLVALWKHHIQSWRRKFPHFYYQSVYWYYYQLQKWGKKNGFPVHKTETSQEYIQRIIKQIPVDKREVEYNGDTYQLEKLFYQLNNDYQAAYYGEEQANSTEAYRLLMRSLW